MMESKECIKVFIVAASLALFAVPIFSQQVNTLYFMENVPYRTYLNPAFQPERDGYVGLPVLGYGQLSVGNTQFSVKDFFYKNPAGVGLVSFLHPQYGDKDKFFGRIKKTPFISADYQMNLLSFGFRVKEKSYFTFGINERIDAGVTTPRDLFKLLLYGNIGTDENGKPILRGNQFDLKSLGVGASAYTEIGFGYSTKSSDKLSLGIRLKLLLGTANVSLSNDDLKLNADVEEWRLTGTSTLNMSSPLTVSDDFKFGMPSGVGGWLKPSGYGASFDLGVSYNFFKWMQFSVALTDFGFIYWNGNVKNLTAKVDYSFKGVEVSGSSLLDGFNSGGIVDSLKSGVMNSFNLNGDNSKDYYISMPTAKLNAGLEFNFYKNKFGVGILSRTMMYNKRFFEELTASFSIRPVNWFNMNISYSFLNGRSSLGTGLGLRVGPILFFVAADYIPLSYVSYNKIPIPHNVGNFNLAGGISIVWGKRDKDKDGVPNKFDLCPNTPKGVVVDSVGCPLDTDGDGVPDYLDLCPCTPPEAYALIDSVGCPLDTDGDSVPDYLDQCPNTPVEAYLLIDSVGCPLDTDGDGVPDYLDQCPNTPFEAIGFVDSIGCPLDTDGDGVSDYLDKCPNTPEKVAVDSLGCPLDGDGDGVPDYLDQCPDTPKEAIGKVDKKGCPLDMDGDGVPDYLDLCPTVPGSKSNNGCPEIKQEVKKLFTKALQGIQFATGKSVILKSSYSILNQIANVMVENPTYNLEIGGHTDNVGDPFKNLDLSEKRANSVKYYLITKGIDPYRLKATGFGDTVPVATNKTAAGRKTNRRVEFVVKFETVTYETVKKTESEKTPQVPKNEMNK